MAKKLIDIEYSIYSRSGEFYTYLQKKISIDAWSLLEVLVSKTQVYLFSGVIRNYFIRRKYDELRDIDFIISDEIDIEILFPQLLIRKNSFGGYKILVDQLSIDIWVIKNTWGLNQGQTKFEYKQLDHLPNTTFFNFSSIVFSINDRKFTIGKPFLRFLAYKRIDVVYEKNPYPALCIVNSFYYSDKYHFKFSKRLIDYILSNYNENIENFDKVQLKHFGRIVYERGYLLHRISTLALK